MQKNTVIIENCDCQEEKSVRKKAILVVSYGTSHKEARERAIDGIEKRIKEEFQEYEIYRAFTGKRVVKKMEQTGTHVMILAKALERLKDEGIQKLIVQPTYVTKGNENDNMIEKVKAVSGEFQHTVIGKPLLNDEKDCWNLAEIIADDCPVEENEALILMGHGTSGYGNLMYHKLNEVFKDMGYKNIQVATMKGEPSFQEAQRKLEQLGVKKVILNPLMIAAGEHVKKDMAGKENSWKSELEKKGYRVECHMRGLGEVMKVQNQFIEHINEALG